MDFKKRKLKFNILIRFFLSYLLILSFPVMAGIFVYSKTINTFENETLSNNLSLVEQTRDLLDRRLQEVDAMSSQLMLNSYIKQFMYFKGPVQEIDNAYTMWDVWTNLPEFKVTNSFIYNYYIYFRNSNIIMSPEALYDVQEYYDHYFSYSNISFDEWKNTILLTYHLKNFLPLQQVTINKESTSNKKSKSVVTYMQSINLDTNAQPIATIVILIDGNEVQRIMKQMISSNDGYVEITNSEGSLIASIGKPPESDISVPAGDSGYTIRQIGGEKVLLSYTKSNYNGWRYTITLPAREVLQKINYLKNILNVSLFVCLVLGVVLAYFISYRNTAPISKMIKTLKQRGEVPAFGGKNEYDFLKNAISNLIETDDILKEKMIKQIPSLRNAFLYRLVKGGFNDINEIMTTMAEVKMNIEGEFFVILLMRIEGYSDLLSANVLRELNASKILIQSTIKSIYDKAYYTDIDERTVVFLMSLDCKDEDECFKLVDTISSVAVKQLEQQYNIKLTITAGNMKRNLPDLFYSLMEAQQVLDLEIVDNSSVVMWNRNIGQANEVFYYPIDVEIRLTSIVRTGDKEEVGKVFNMLYEKNFVERNLSNEMVQLFYRELKGTLIKIAGKLPAIEGKSGGYLKEIIQEVNKNIFATNKYEYIKSMFIELADYMSMQKMNVMNTLKHQLTDYIYANYSDINLTLYQVASAFHYTEDYLSNFFKSHIGQSFTTYVENIRLTKACELIKDGGMTIEEISEQVGYNSSRVFRRAFNRCYGVSPTLYKGSTILNEDM